MLSTVASHSPSCFFWPPAPTVYPIPTLPHQPPQRAHMTCEHSRKIGRKKNIFLWVAELYWVLEKSVKVMTAWLGGVEDKGRAKLTSGGRKH